MRAVGNALAEFRFHEFGAAEMVMLRDGDRLHLGVDAPGAKIVAQLDTRPLEGAPAGSVWRSLEELDALRRSGDAVAVAASFTALAVPDSVEELLLARTWGPAFEVVGLTGAPPPDEAGNVLRPSTGAKLSVRVPPTADPQEAAAALVKALCDDPPHGANVSVEPGTADLHDHVVRALDPRLGHLLDHRALVVGVQPYRLHVPSRHGRPVVVPR